MKMKIYQIIFYFVFGFLILQFNSCIFFPKKVIQTDSDIKLNSESLQNQYSYENFDISIYGNTKNSFIQILKNNINVFSLRRHYFEVLTENKTSDDNLHINVGDDITGDGNPNLIIREWTGGVHCCDILHLFNLGPSFKYLQAVNLKHGGDGFINLDDDPALELVIRDWSFAYWKTSFSRSPAPKIVLKFDSPRYRISHKLMKQPMYDEKKLIKKANEINALYNWEEASPPYQLWSAMLDLIYSGNMNQAMKIYEMSWKSSFGGKEVFLADFLKKLHSSPYWEDIKILNKKL